MPVKNYVITLDRRKKKRITEEKVLQHEFFSSVFFFFSVLGYGLILGQITYAFTFCLEPTNRLFV